MQTQTMEGNKAEEVEQANILLNEQTNNEMKQTTKPAIVHAEEQKALKVISGMQDGADLAGLEAAMDSDIPTGGMAPKNYYTKHGSDKAIGMKFGLIECEEFGYPPRTEWNVRNSDATIRFASDFNSLGEKCTLNAIKRHGKPYLDIPVSSSDAESKILSFIKDNSVKVLNIAGNIDSKTHDYTYGVLINVFNKINNKMKQTTEATVAKPQDKATERKTKVINVKETTIEVTGAKPPKAPENEQKHEQIKNKTTKMNKTMNGDETCLKSPVQKGAVDNVIKTQINNMKTAKTTLDCATTWSEKGDEEYKKNAAIKSAARALSIEVSHNFKDMFCFMYTIGQLQYSNGINNKTGKPYETPKVPKIVNKFVTKLKYYREEPIIEVRHIDDEDREICYTKYVPVNTAAEATMSRLEKYTKVYGEEYKNRIARTRLLFRKSLEDHYKSALAQVRDIFESGVEEFPGKEPGTYCVPYILVQVVKGKRGNEPTAVKLESVTLEKFNDTVSEAEDKIYSFFEELEEYNRTYELELKQDKTNALVLVPTDTDEVEYEVSKDSELFLKYEVNKKTKEYSDNLVIGQLYNKKVYTPTTKCKVCGTKLEVTPRVQVNSVKYDFRDQGMKPKPDCICDECFGTDVSLIESKDDISCIGHTEVDYIELTDEERTALRRDRCNLDHGRRYVHLCKTVEQVDFNLKDIRVEEAKIKTNNVTKEDHISVRLVLKNEEGDVTRWQKLKYYISEYLELYGEAAKALYNECFISLKNGIDMEGFNWIIDMYMKSIKQSKKMVTIPRSTYKGFVAIEEYEIRRAEYMHQLEAAKQQSAEEYNKNLRKTLYSPEEVEVEKVLKRGEWSCTKLTLYDNEKGVKYILSLNQKAMMADTVTTKDETGKIVSFKVEQWLINKANCIPTTPMAEPIGVKESVKPKIKVFDVRAKYVSDFKVVTTLEGNNVKTVAKYMPHEEVPKEYTENKKYFIGVTGTDNIEENKVTCSCGCNKLIKDTFNGVLICSKCGLEQKIQHRHIESSLSVTYRKTEFKSLEEDEKTKDKSKPENYELWYIRNFGVAPTPMTVE